MSKINYKKLSLNYNIKSTCWISNISITPFVQNVILIKEVVSKNYKISGPNFSVKIVNSNQNTIDNVSSLDEFKFTNYINNDDSTDEDILAQLKTGLDKLF